MNRRNFLKMCTGAAVAVAAGMELSKKDTVEKAAAARYLGDVRLKLHALYNGMPPYDPAELEKRGFASMSNVNFKRIGDLVWSKYDYTGKSLVEYYANDRGLPCPPTS
jgi:hypothetical protein